MAFDGGGEIYRRQELAGAGLGGLRPVRYAHAAIRGIETEAAREAEGVLAVLTGADMEAAGYGRGVAMMPFQGRDGALKVVLPLDRVRYVGEPGVCWWWPRPRRRPAMRWNW